MRSRIKNSTKNDNIHCKIEYKNFRVNTGGVKGWGGLQLERYGTRSTCTEDDIWTTPKTCSGTHTYKRGKFTAQYYKTRNVTERGVYALVTTAARYKKFSLKFVS